MWLNPKFKTVFRGRYNRIKSVGGKVERIFELVNDKGRCISFESWQQARSLGWRKA